MRLGVKTGSWTPSASEWASAMKILSTYEPNEHQRINRLRVEEDRKRSLIGRLLLRYSCSVHSDIPVERIRLERSEQNKPFCPDLKTAQVNISHHGDWVVLASHPARQVGVDVMRYETPKRGVEEFFKTMQRQFTQHEWECIGDSIHSFYRFWALKESFVKGIGVGIGFSLQRASFTLLEGGAQATVEIDSVFSDEWEFTLTELDDNHCVAVALGPLVAAGPEPSDSAPTSFTILTPAQLIEHFPVSS